MPQISVIVPVYNVEKYLKRCVDSILKQTFFDFELILVDDGSNDKSGEICDQLAEKEDRIKVFHKENGGVSSARNMGIDNAAGNYIMFVDSDDYIKENMIEALWRLMEEQNDLAVSSIEMIESGRHKKYYLKEKKYNSASLLEEYCEEEIPQICLCGPCGKLYKKSIIDKNRFDLELRIGEDTYFNMEYIKSCQSIATTGEIYYYYMRENTESLFSKFRPYYYDNTRAVYEHTLKVCQDIHCTERSKKALTKCYVKNLLGNLNKAVMTTNKHICKEYMRNVQNDSVFQGNVDALRTNWKQYVIGALIRKKHYEIAYLAVWVWKVLKK